MVEDGELTSVVLYRDFPGNRWRYAIYDTVGVWCGWLPDLEAEAPFDVAAEALANFPSRALNQAARWPWLEEKPDWWTAGPAPK